MFAFMYLVLWSHSLQLDAGVPIVDLLNAQWYFPRARTRTLTWP